MDIKAKTSLTYRFWPIVAFLGPGIIWLATSVYGPGVSGDSLRYLSVAQNICNGLGWVDYSMQPLLAWPPLYPLILAGGSCNLGDVFVFGSWLNIFLFGVNIFLSAKLAEFILTDFAPAPFLVSLIILSSPSLIRLHTSIAADPLFLFFVLVFLLLSGKFLVLGKKRFLVSMLIVAAFAGILKYPGLAMALVGGIVTYRFFRQEKNNFYAISIGMGFSGLAILPLTIWVIFHNYLQYGSLFGARGNGSAFDNLYITLEKILYWFFPYSIQQHLGVFWFTLIILFFVFAIVRPGFWYTYARQLFSKSFFPVTLFFTIYFLMMIFLVSYAEHKDYRVDRLHIILLIPILLFLFELAYTVHLRWVFRPILSKEILIICFVLIWIVFPATNSIKYLRLSLAQGEISNNLYNTSTLNESDLVRYLQSTQFSYDDVIYSNHEGAAWFYLRRNVLSMPQMEINSKNEVNLEQVLAKYNDWPPSQGYIIWFDLDFKQHIVQPNNLKSLAKVQPVFVGKSGGVYKVERLNSP